MGERDMKVNKGRESSCDVIEATWRLQCSRASQVEEHMSYFVSFWGDEEWMSYGKKVMFLIFVCLLASSDFHVPF